MIDTVNLLPPGFGPRADPLLFGVSEGLMRLFPLPTAARADDGGNASALDAGPEPVPAPTPPAVEA